MAVRRIAMGCGKTHPHPRWRACANKDWREPQMPGKRTSFFANSFSMLKQTFAEWLEDQAPQLGAALAYYTVFSLAPLVLLVLAIVGFLFHDDPAGTWKKLTEQMSYFLDQSAVEVVRNIAE